jgi:uracil-DNA glycosylase family 4
VKTVEWQKLKTATEDCKKCPALVYSRCLYAHGKPSFGYGSVNSPIVVVGQCPGQYGCGRTGIPFTADRSGQLYQDTLKSLGLQAENVYTTNVVKCCPENNRTPTPAELNNCSAILLDELHIIDPKVVFALGKLAQEKVGQINQKMPFLIIKLYHPAWYLRTGNPQTFTAEFVKEYRKVQEIFKLSVEKQAKLTEFEKP